jgi:hypothetical protein
MINYYKFNSLVLDSNLQEELIEPCFISVFHYNNHECDNNLILVLHFKIQLLNLFIEKRITILSINILLSCLSNQNFSEKKSNIILKNYEKLI